jgi:hypothetical protein
MIQLYMNILVILGAVVVPQQGWAEVSHIVTLVTNVTKSGHPVH